MLQECTGGDHMITDVLATLDLETSFTESSEENSGKERERFLELLTNLEVNNCLT